MLQKAKASPYKSAEIKKESVLTMLFLGEEQEKCSTGERALKLHIM